MRDIHPIWGLVYLAALAATVAVWTVVKLILWLLG